MLILNSSTIHFPFWRDCTRKDFRSVLYRTLGPLLKESSDCLTCGNILRLSSSQPKWDAVSRTERFSEGAIAEMELPPEKLLFVDDDPHYVKEAIGLGLNGVLMVRSGEPTDVDVEWVRDLEEIGIFL